MIAYNYPTLRPRGSGDRASASGAEGRRFESYRGRHLIVSFGRVGGWLTLKPSRPPVLFSCFSWDQDLAVRNLWSLCFRGSCPRVFGACRFAAASCVLSLVLPVLSALASSLRAPLIQIGMNCSSSCIGGPPCWKRGGEFGQIDDNRWSAIRLGGVPQSRNSLTWGFAGAFFLVASRMPENGPIRALRPPIIVRLPESGGVFATTAPLREPPLLCEPLLANPLCTFVAIVRRAFRLGPLS